MKYVPDAALTFFAKAYAIVPNVLEKFASGEDWNDGTIYRYPYRGGSRLLKVMGMNPLEPCERERLEERIDYLAYLGTHGVPIIFPQPSTRGNLIEQVEIDGIDYQAYTYDMIAGHHLDREDPRTLKDIYRRWGQAIGAIHRRAKSYPHWECSPTPDPTGKPIISWRREMDFFHEMLNDDEVKALWRDMQAELEIYPRTRENFGFIHNDPHAHNFLINGDQTVLIDFDVANYHWFIVDLAIAVYSELYRIWRFQPVPLATKRLVVDSLIEGYLRENALPNTELDRLEYFLHYRRILMFALFSPQIKANRPDYLESMKHDLLERVPLLQDDRM